MVQQDEAATSTGVIVRVEPVAAAVGHEAG